MLEIVLGLTAVACFHKHEQGRPELQRHACRIAWFERAELDELPEEVRLILKRAIDEKLAVYPSHFGSAEALRTYQAAKKRRIARAPMTKQADCQVFHVGTVNSCICQSGLLRGGRHAESLRRLGMFVELSLYQRVENGLFAGKMLVERRCLDVDAGGNLAHARGVEPPLREQPERRVENDGFCLLRLAHGLSFQKANDC